jgi:F0F1-type ATP synthase gamma subunit
MQLLSIKKRIATNANILKITKSLKIMCLTRLKSLSLQIKNIENAVLNVENILFNLNENENIKNDNPSKKKENTKIIRANLFLFTDMSFCGSLNKSTEKAINNENNEQTTENFIIGNKGKKQKYNANETFLCKLYDKNVLNITYENIVNYFNEKYLEVQNNNLKIEHSFKLKIYSLNKCENMDYLFYKNMYDNNTNIKQISFNVYFKYILQKYIINFQKEESYIRLIKLTAAIDNSEELANELKMYYNKTRQMLITGEVLETIASSSVNVQ